MGLPDFSIFYTAGKILHQGHGAELYDNAEQEKVQNSFSQTAIEKRGSILPYNHPPFEALIFAPLARFSYLNAYLIWLAINIGLVATLPFILRPHLDFLGKENIWIWFLALVAFYPIVIALVQGQDSILLLFCYCMAYSTMRRRYDFQAGAWLGLGLFKFHLLLSFVAPLFFLSRKKLISGFTVVIAVLFFLGFLPGGSVGWLRYPLYVWESERNQSYLWNLSLGNTANLRGLISALLPSTHPWWRGSTLAILSGVLLAGVLLAWRKADGESAQSFELPFSVGVIVTVLLSYHIYTHDLSLIFLAAVLALEYLQTTATVRPQARHVSYICLALLFCTPVYLLLSVHFKQLELLAAILLVFLAVILKEFMWPRQSPSQ